MIRILTLLISCINCLNGDQGNVTICKSVNLFCVGLDFSSAVLRGSSVLRLKVFFFYFGQVFLSNNFQTKGSKCQSSYCIPRVVCITYKDNSINLPEEYMHQRNTCSINLPEEYMRDKST